MAKPSGKSQRLSLYNNSLNLAMAFIQPYFLMQTQYIAFLPIYKTPFLFFILPRCLIYGFSLYIQGNKALFLFSSCLAFSYIQCFPYSKNNTFLSIHFFFFYILPRLQGILPYIRHFYISLQVFFLYISIKDTLFSYILCPDYECFAYIYIGNRHFFLFQFLPRIYMCFLYIGKTILFYIYAFSFLCFAQNLGMFIYRNLFLSYILPRRLSVSYIYIGIFFIFCPENVYSSIQLFSYIQQRLFLLYIYKKHPFFFLYLAQSKCVSYIWYFPIYSIDTPFLFSFCPEIFLYIDNIAQIFPIYRNTIYFPIYTILPIYIDHFFFFILPRLLIYSVFSIYIQI